MNVMSVLVVKQYPTTTLARLYCNLNHRTLSGPPLRIRFRHAHGTANHGATVATITDTMKASLEYHPCA